MVHSDDAFSCFSQAGVSFDEIILEGAAGGIGAVIRYLQSRRQILLRDSSQISLRNDDPAHFVRAVEVIDDALSLLNQLSVLNVRAVLEEAAGRPTDVSQNAAEALPLGMDAGAHSQP